MNHNSKETNNEKTLLKKIKNFYGKSVIAFYDLVANFILIPPLAVTNYWLIFLDSPRQITNINRFDMPAMSNIILTSIEAILIFSMRHAKHDKEMHFMRFRRGAHHRRISLREVQTVELGKLTPEEKKKAGKRLGINKYLKISLKTGKREYIPIAGYSKKQVKKIIEILLSEKDLPAEE